MCEDQRKSFENVSSWAWIKPNLARCFSYIGVWCFGDFSFKYCWDVCFNGKSLHTWDWCALLGCIISAILTGLSYHFFSPKISIKEYEQKIGKLKHSYYKDIKNIYEEQLEKGEINSATFWYNIFGTVAKIYNFTCNERISLYTFKNDESSNREEFIMLGRYSENREYSKAGRGRHSIKEGCIGKAWVDPEKYYFKNDFPKEDDDYNNTLIKDFHFDEQTVKKLRMRARTVGCCALYNRAEMDRVAVLVFESIDRCSKILTESIMLRIYNDYKENFNTLIENNKKSIPVDVESDLEMVNNE